MLLVVLGTFTVILVAFLSSDSYIARPRFFGGRREILAKQIKTGST